jgi:pyridoxal phosphate enzyme (YggS family)
VTDTLAARWAAVRQRVDDACVAAGRAPGEVTILPVSKTFGVDAIGQAMALGLHRFGENKVQEIRDKAAALPDTGIEWVVIGHLQTNKAKDVARLAAEVQTLDRLELATELDRRLQQAGRAIDVLVQVKTAAEETKSGVEPGQLLSLLRQLQACSSLRVRGLMTLATASDDENVVRGCFSQLRGLAVAAREEGYWLPRLSMGMSGDFFSAILEGATEVRIGSAIFGARNGPTGLTRP